jgi:thiol-disulfide isomerase/thioredoxin
MSRSLLLSSVAVFCTFMSVPILRAQADDAIAHDPRVLLQEVSATLSSLQQVSYHYHRELNYPSEGYRTTLEGDVSLEFDPRQEPSGFIYQAHSEKGFEIFNGSEILRANFSDHTLQMAPAHTTKDLDHLSFLYNSMATLRLALPVLIQDTTIMKSIAECSDIVCAVDLRIPRATLTATGQLSPIRLARDFTYRIVVDRKSLLPVEVKETNDVNSDSMLVQFSNVNNKIEKLPPESWRYSSYRDYRLVTSTAGKSLLALGSIAPDWALPVANAQGGVVSLREVLSNPQTKLVLLEFWISHCGYSIDAVPKLNAISAKYGSSGVKILAVNPDDNESTIQLFVQNNMPRYTLLSRGSEIAEQYGVAEFPFIFLVNTAGKIVFVGGLDEERLSETIAKLLQ